MSKHKPRARRHVKSVNLALQGGGAHGAFTWGVLDKMFEEDRIWIEAISGTSAGAMNAVVAAQGMYDGGAAGARKALDAFWCEVSRSAAFSPFQRTPLDRAAGNWSLNFSPGYNWVSWLTGIASPYQFNPLGINPMQGLLDTCVDFGKVRDCEDLHLFISATNVETGRVHVFKRDEITPEVIMASSCLPHLFQAVEIDGVPYWDGGYMGNPVLFPLIDESPCADIAIVQINPILKAGTPKTAREIQNRVNEITFNSSLMKELRTIDMIDRLMDGGKLGSGDFRRINVHMIEDRHDLRPLDASSKMNVEWPFLQHLKEIGRKACAKWLTNHFDDLGKRSSIDLREMFGTTKAPVKKAGAAGVR